MAGKQAFGPINVLKLVRHCQAGARVHRAGQVLFLHPHLSMPPLPTEIPLTLIPEPAPPTFLSPQALVPLTALKELVLCVEALPPPLHEHDEEDNAAAAAAGGEGALPAAAAAVAAATDGSAAASAATDEAAGPSTLVSSTVPSAGGGGGGDGHSPWSRCMEHTSGMRGLEVGAGRGGGVMRRGCGGEAADRVEATPLPLAPSAK